MGDASCRGCTTDYYGDPARCVRDGCVRCCYCYCGRELRPGSERAPEPALPPEVAAWDEARAILHRWESEHSFGPGQVNVSPAAAHSLAALIAHALLRRPRKREPR